MKPLIVAVMGRKGGTGKTTLALCLAAAWTRKGRRVLLADLDPQGSASLALGLTADGERAAAVLAGMPAGENAPYVAFTACPSLSVLPGGPALETLTDPRPLRDTLATDADFILVDCPPGHPALDRVAMQAADVALVCCEPHRLAIAGAARVLSEAAARKPAPPACAVVLGRMDPRRGLDRAAPDLLAGAFAAPVLSVRTDAGLAAAMNAGKLPPETGRAAEDVEAVARWISKQGRGTP